MDLPRRTLVGAALSAGALTACNPKDEPAPVTPPPSPAAPPGARQRGVTDPVPRQRYLVLRVLDLVDTSGRAPLPTVLADLGDQIDALGSDDDLTVTVGLGPDALRTARGGDGVGTEGLPPFTSDALEVDASGGDLMLQVCADRKETARAAADRLVQLLADPARERWGIDGYRGEVDGVAARNVLGFYDGIAGPTTEADLDDAVWTDESDGLADATLCVVRRIRLDHRRFGLLPVEEQEATFGRAKRTGVPLSGGDITADVDLRATNGAGVLDIPDDAHARRAHPLVSGAGRSMLRRSYSYRAAPDDQGLVFICFQRDLQVFVRTQSSMDGGDRLLDFATTTGSATFLLLPGWDAATPLGAAVFA